MRLIFLLILLLAALIFVLIWATKDPLFLKPGKNPSTAKADPRRLRAHVEKLSNDLVPRSIFQPETLSKVADYIRAQWEADGLSVEEQTYSIPETGSKSYRLLIVRFPGTSTDSRPLVIGAHYDAIAVTPGADDNASAVAALLELSKIARKNPPAIALELVAYPNEESPTFGSEQMGSYQHAKLLHDQHRAIRGMLSLEMLGYYQDGEGTQTFPLKILNYLYPTRGNFLCFASTYDSIALVRKSKRHFAQASTFPVESFLGPSLIHGLLNSDHASYIRLGFPAAMVTDTAFYRNPHYHTPEDRPETLDYERMARVVEGLHGMLLNWR